MYFLLLVFRRFSAPLYIGPISIPLKVIVYFIQIVNCLHLFFCFLINNVEVGVSALGSLRKGALQETTTTTTVLKEFLGRPFRKFL